nr:Druantia anti-phage system protein DruA [Thiolapillus sp.]
MTRTAGAPIGCQRPSRFWGLGCPKIYHEVEDTLDAKGDLQTSGCLKALRELEASGHFALPEAQRKVSGVKSPRRLTESVPLPVAVPDEVNAIAALELVPVQDTEQMRIWNELMLTEHYLEAATLVGRQMRYLIRSEHGWLGGIGFAAPALQQPTRVRKIPFVQENVLCASCVSWRRKLMMRNFVASFGSVLSVLGGRRILPCLVDSIRASLTENKTDTAIVIRCVIGVAR